MSVDGVTAAAPADELNALIAHAAGGLFNELSGLTGDRARDLADAGGFAPKAWAQIQAAGFPLALLDEDRGGVGPIHGAAIACMAGAHALAAPLVETMAANWLLARVGLPTTDAPTTLGETPLDLKRTDGVWRLTGVLRRVAWAGAGGLVCAGLHAGDAFLIHLPAGGFGVERQVGVSGEARYVCTVDAAVPADRLAPLPVLGEIRLLGAALRAAQLAGALEATCAMTTGYVRERRQFGKPLAAFQSVRQTLAVMATQAAAARVAAELGAEAIGETIRLAPVAVAKARASEAAGLVAASAHQLHGAMGFTLEYPLHLLTRRLWTWRDDFGGEAEWAIALGRTLAGEGGERLWPALTRI